MKTQLKFVILGVIIVTASLFGSFKVAHACWKYDPDSDKWYYECNYSYQDPYDYEYQYEYQYQYQYPTPTPVYGTPSYGTPSYGTPYDTPGYGTPAYGTPYGYEYEYQYQYQTPIVPPTSPSIKPGSGASGGIDNTVCAKITLRWNDNSNNETGFRVYRSTTSGSGYSNVSGNLAANTTSYQDTPPSTGVTYYYVVRSYINYPPISESVNSNESSAQNLPCIPNLTNSSKIITKVNGSNYNGNTQIKNGDTLTYQITVVNSGQANATVNYICDTPSSNLTNLRNLTVSGSGATGSTITANSASCSNNYKLNVSGTKNIANNWIITFDATIATSSSNLQDVVTNTAGINYTDTQGTHTTNTSAPNLLVNSGNGNTPNFQEVAP